MDASSCFTSRELSLPLKLQAGGTPPRRAGLRKRRSLPDTLPSQEPPKKKPKHVTNIRFTANVILLDTESSRTKYEVEVNADGVK